jgi:hypothetical protein
MLSGSMSRVPGSVEQGRLEPKDRPVCHSSHGHRYAVPSFPTAQPPTPTRWRWSLHTGAAPGLVARPVFPDAIVAGQYTIQFARRDGRVSGFEIGHPRARGVTFARTEGP